MQLTKQNIVIGIAGLVIIIGIIVYFAMQSLMISFPTSEEAGISFSTIASERPESSSCVNEAGELESIAKEIISTEDFVVSLAFGESIISDEAWADYEPSSPYRKNINRDTMFKEHCFYRSPDAPVNCQGDACAVMRNLDGYTWMELSQVESQDCFADAGADCAANGVDDGAISVTVTRKCHQIVFEDEIYDLVDPAGNRYVMHATADDAPNLDPELPEGWAISRVEIDEPLEILPFGGGDNCFHNVMRDSLGQGYHQYIFASPVYP